MSYNHKCLAITFVILTMTSYLALLGILAAVYNEKYTEKDKFEFIYYMSKILTIKSIIVNNHYSELLNDFSSTGKPSTIPNTYRNLLKLNKNKGECIENYRPCGILDTYGNVLCIEDYLPCPVNKMKVSHIDAADYYLNLNYKTTPLSSVSNNYQFFYSNEFQEGNAVAIIIKKTKEEPKFISLNNFILDSELYEEFFGGDDEFLKEIADLFDIDVDKDKKNENDIVDDVIKIFEVVTNFFDDLNGLDIAFKGAKLLVKILLNESNKRIERFEKFVKEKIEILDEKNNDVFFEHIGDYFYSKNYIGFKSVQDIDNFLRYDFSIYKKIFPTFQGSTCALAGLIFITVLTAFLIIYFLASLKNGRYNFSPPLMVIFSIIFYVPALGFFIYSLKTYINVNKSKTLDDLKSIKSDEFINEFINDFINDCQKSTLVLCTLFITLGCIILNIISFIILKLLHGELKGLNLYIY